METKSFGLHPLLATQYLSIGSALNNLVPNPFVGLVQTGALSQSTVKEG